MVFSSGQPTILLNLALERKKQFTSNQNLIQTQFDKELRWNIVLGRDVKQLN